MKTRGKLTKLMPEIYKVKFCNYLTDSVHSVIVETDVKSLDKIRKIAFQKISREIINSGFNFTFVGLEIL